MNIIYVNQTAKQLKTISSKSSLCFRIILNEQIAKLKLSIANKMGCDSGKGTIIRREIILQYFNGF